MAFLLLAVGIKLMNPESTRFNEGDCRRTLNVT